jgi:hypothetical protein
VDADDVESLGADVLELVWSLRGYDDDVTGTSLDVPTVRRDQCLSGADDPGLGVGMLVQVRPLPGLVVDEEALLAFPAAAEAGKDVAVECGDESRGDPRSLRYAVAAKRRRLRRGKERAWDSR